MDASIAQILQEKSIFLLSLFPLLLPFFFIYKWLSPTKTRPPSPFKLPIIGNLHQLGSLPFHDLRTLSQRYGDIMLLHLGSKPTIVISSAELASQVLKTHDLIFANRPELSIFNKVLGNGTMTASSYGEYWRQIRRICMLELLGSKSVRNCYRVREEEMLLIMKMIREVNKVNLSDMLMSMSNDMICRVIFGRKYKGEKRGVDFTKLLDGFIELLGGFFIGDYIGWLAWIDKINGVDAKVEMVTSTFDLFLEGVLRDHENCDRAQDGDKAKDFVDVLLEVVRDEAASEYPLLKRDSLKGILQDMFTGGSETIAVVLEWAMSELLKNPRVMQELHEEVSRVAEGKEKVIEEDLSNMNYLRAVLKETLRLHPPLPLLVPHACTKDIKINGYDIDAGTQVIVNASAISRNSRYWEDPQSFYPERFVDSPIDFKGHDLEFIPFGSGRRMCPGIALATASMELVLANLVLNFEWSLPNGASPVSLDMSEAPGISIHRAVPLVVVASPRFN